MRHVEYRTIVADPPWDHSDGTGYSFGRRDPRGRSGKHGPTSHSLPYPIMTLEEIKALPVEKLSAPDATLYLWTTNRYLENAYDIVRAWGYKPGTLLVWCKPKNQGLFGGGWLSNVEYVLTGKRGSPKVNGKEGTRWYEWPRRAHSEKPEAMQDMVERMNDAPYLELFARRQRLGWDTWGNEALNHVELVPHIVQDE